MVQEPTEEIEIIDFQPQYASDFRRLNYEWLATYFEVEPYDEIVLNNPAREVIDRGGLILFAVAGGNTVGTCALLKQTDRKYELAKMAVTEQYRGRGIGRKLLNAAIKKAEDLGADTIVLATSTKLAAANHLYESMGFEYVSMSELGPIPYKRQTVAMELVLARRA